VKISQLSVGANRRGKHGFADERRRSDEMRLTVNQGRALASQTVHRHHGRKLGAEVVIQMLTAALMIACATGARAAPPLMTGAEIESHPPLSVEERQDRKSTLVFIAALAGAGV
jgi:hypothetical protein